MAVAFTSWVRIVLLVGSLLFGSTSTKAQVAVSVMAGTLGPGLGVSWRATDRLQVRGGGYLFRFSGTRTVVGSEIDTRFDGAARIDAAGLFLDWYPFDGRLGLVAGVVRATMEISGSGVPIESWFMEGKEFPPERLGTLSMKITYPRALKPYVGLALGNSIRGRRVGFFAEVGVLAVGTPLIDMTGSGMIGATENWESELQQGFSSFRWYPLLAAGLRFRL